MGAIIEQNDSNTFDLLKDLETARHNLYTKQNEVIQDSETKVVENNEDIVSPLPIEWIQEEPSDILSNYGSLKGIGLYI